MRAFMANEPEKLDLSSIKVCEEKMLPPGLLLEAAERSVVENPENSPSGSADAARMLGVDSAALETFGAIITGKKWKNGRVLRVRHLDGDAATHAKVEQYARRWEDFAGISFSFVGSGDAEIRISYHLDNRSWSWVGTEALAIPAGEETMHFGWLLPSTTEDESRRVILHEFGHVLGMIHEHQHPTAGIRWDRKVIERYYTEVLGWTLAAVKNNLFTRIAAAETQFSAYDPQSIMHYPVPPEFTLDNVAVGWNTDLSDTDKRFIASVYPRPTPAAAPARVGAGPAADVGGRAGGAAPPALGSEGVRGRLRWRKGGS
jgi:serralysin